MNIYVGGFPQDTTGEELQQSFETFGQVSSARVIRDKFTGDSRGFGFVEMPDPKQAQAAMDGLKEINGKKVTVNEARPQAARPSFGGNRGGSHGSNGRGRRDRGYY